MIMILFLNKFVLFKSNEMRHKINCIFGSCIFARKNVNKTLYLKPVLELAVINSLWAVMTSEKYDIEDPVKSHVMHILGE